MLAITNKAAMTFVYKSLYGYVPLDEKLRMEWLKHMVSIFLNFRETTKLFFKVVIPF